MKKYLVTGLIAIIPLAFLGWVISLIYKPISSLVGSQGLWSAMLIIAIVVGSVFLLGFALSHIKLFKLLKAWIENKIIYKLPIVKTAYKFAKDMVEGALEEKTYDQIVKAYPFGRGGASAIGFLTNKEISAVFVMSAPNPLSGHVYFDCDYDLLDWTYDQAIKFNISVGTNKENVEDLK